MTAQRYTYNDLVIRVKRYNTGSTDIVDISISRKGILIKSDIFYTKKDAIELIKKMTQGVK